MAAGVPETPVCGVARKLVRALLLPALLASGGGALGLELQDPSARYAEACRKGQYAEAIDLAKAAAGQDFGLPAVALAADYAELLYMVGRYDEAQTAMGEVVGRVYEPVYMVRLAEMYRHSGKTADSDGFLQLAIDTNMRGYRQAYPRENLLAMGKVARMRGESPRRILQIYQQRLLQRYPDFVPGFLEAGELALESHGYDVAEEYFLAALALDETRQSALAGLAATYFQAEDPRFDEIRVRLEALNPHQPRLQCLVIERDLMAGDLAGAKAVLDDLMGINPVHHEGMAYRAAVAFLEGDGAGQQEFLDRLGELNPQSALGYRILGDLAARRYRFDEAAAFLRQGLKVEPDNLDVKASLGLNLLRLGEDATGRVLLEEVFAEDAYNVQAYNMLEVLDSLDAFQVVSNSDFTIHLPAREAAVMGGELLAFLGEALARYSDEYTVEVKRPVFVQIFDDHDEFMVRSIGLPGNAGHLGICFGNLVTLDSPRARDPHSMNWRSVLWHEFVHVITLQKTANRIPRWLSEGISVYEEGQRDPGWGQPLDPDFKPLLDPEAWPSVESLEDYFVRPDSPAQLMLGYYLAGAFVEAYVGAYGKPALVAALDAMRTGVPAGTALRDAAGAGADVNAIFAAYLEQSAAPLETISPPDTPDEGAPKPFLRGSPFADAIEAGFAARDAGDIAVALEQFELAAAMYPDFPGEENPLRQIVALEAVSGDLDRWYAAVQRLQRHDPTAFAESKALMEALSTAGDWTRATQLANWCLGIDPFDLDLYQTRLVAETALGDREGMLATLDHLAELDSAQADAYRLAQARQLLGLKRPEQARRIVLTLLETYPEYSAAQELLLELHESGEELGRDGA